MALPESVDRSVRAAATLTYTELYNEGRASANDADEWPHAQCIEVLDSRICPLCASINGMVVAVDSPEYAEWRQPSHIGCRRRWAQIHRDEHAEVTFQRPSQELIEKHGHYHIRPRKYAELRMPAEPAGRHFIVRRTRHPETGELRTVLDWAPWWEQVPEAERALVLRARATESAEELRSLLLALDIADPLHDAEDFRRAVLLGLRDRLEGFVTDTRVARRLREVEDRIVEERVEWLVALTPAGDEVLRVRGEQYSVKMSPEETRLLRGAHVTHNHTAAHRYPEGDPRHRGNSFSPQDVAAAAKYRVREMRAVSPEWRHSLRPGPDGWDLDYWQQTLKPTAQRHYAEVSQELADRVNMGELTPAEASAEMWHEVWTRVARELGLIYYRVPRR